MQKNSLASIPLFKANQRNISAHDFENAIKSLGIQKGDILFVHSDLSVFGKLLLFKRSQLLETILQVFKTCVGSKGSIVMPTFSFSFCKNEVFDVDQSRSTDGVLTEYFRKQPDVQRTIQPIHSCAVFGHHQEDLLNIGKDSFGEKSIFGNLLKLKGKIVYFGATFLSSTFNHHIEQMHGIPYRYIKNFKGTIVNGNKRYDDDYTFNVRYIDKNVNDYPSRFGRFLLDNNLMKKMHIGDGTISAIDSEILFQEGWKKLDQDIFYFLKDKPDL
jgi:aminoglycoside 3-N-acetyltransferase